MSIFLTDTEFHYISTRIEADRRMAENDEMIPVSEAREMAEMIPNAKLEVISGASHNDIFQEGEEVLFDVIDFFLCYND